MGQKAYRPAWDVAEPALPALGLVVDRFAQLGLM